MSRNHKSQLQKELDNRNENKKQSLMEIFIENKDNFKISIEEKANKKAREVLKETVQCNRIIRKDNKAYNSFLQVPGFNYIMGFAFSENDEILYYCLREIKEN